MPEKALHLVVKGLVKEHGADIVGDHRLKGLLADALEESFRCEAVFDLANRMGVGQRLLALCGKSSGRDGAPADVSLALDSIKQRFAIKSNVERPVSDYVVNCMAYGIGLIKKVEKPSLDSTTLGMTQTISKQKEAISQKDKTITRQNQTITQQMVVIKNLQKAAAHTRRVRLVGVMALLLSVVLFGVVAKAVFVDGVDIRKSVIPALTAEEIAARQKAVKDSVQRVEELFRAVSRKENKRADSLIAAGVNVHVRNSQGESLLFAAVRGNNMDFAQKLLNMGFKADERNTAGHYSYEGAVNKTSRYVKNVANKDEYFVRAVEYDRMDSARYFLSLGANVDFVNGTNYTAAHHAAADNHVAALEQLKSWGADLNRETSRGTPIELAIAKNSQKAFRYLLANVPNVANQKVSGGRLLHFAIRDKNRRVWVPALIAAGADIHEQDDAGNEPIHVAAHYGDSTLVKMFIDHGVDPKAENRDGDEVVEIAEKYDNKNVVAYLTQYYFFRRVKGMYNTAKNFVAGMFE